MKRKKFCGQCGKSLSARACGPTHALEAHFQRQCAKITDKMRLDFLQRLKDYGAPQDWFYVNQTDGSIHAWTPTPDSEEEDFSRPKIRQAIDAAMKAERKKSPRASGRKEEGNG